MSSPSTFVRATGTLERQPAAARRSPFVAGLTRYLSSGLVWGLVACVLVSAWILFDMGGRTYYGTPLTVRAYQPAHRILRPSGAVGQTLGVVGMVLLLMPFAYTARKRLASLRRAGGLKVWLEIHLFCGIVGPLLITFHTSFKFNGIISAAYWSMVIVMLSGFVGRYLYVRIPRSIRGNELTLAELDEQASALHAELVDTVGRTDVVLAVDAFEHQVVPLTGARTSLREQLVGDALFGSRLARFLRRLEAEGIEQAQLDAVARVTRARVQLLRQRFHLERTRELFQLWHFFHMPLVILLLVIAAAHIALALYMGYVPFRWT